MLILYSLRKLARLYVVMPFEGQKGTKEPVGPRDYQSLTASKAPGRVDSVIVGFCVDRPQCGRLVSSNPDHSAIPFGAEGLVCVRASLDIGQEGVVVALKDLMVTRNASEIENELHGTDYSYCHPYQMTGKAVAGKHITDSSSTENNHQKVEPASPAFERSTPRGVIQRVAQNIETDVLAARCGHHFFLPMLGGGAAGGDGCRGPTDAPLDVGSAVLKGLANVVDGCRGPSPKSALPGPLGAFFSSLIRIVSDWVGQLGMKSLAGAGTPASDTRILS